MAYELQKIGVPPRIIAEALVNAAVDEFEVERFREQLDEQLG